MAKLVLTSRTSARQALPPAFYLLFTSHPRAMPLPASLRIGGRPSQMRPRETSTESEEGGRVNHVSGPRRLCHRHPCLGLQYIGSPLAVSRLPVPVPAPCERPWVACQQAHVGKGCSCQCQLGKPFG